MLLCCTGVAAGGITDDWPPLPKQLFVVLISVLPLVLVPACDQLLTEAPPDDEVFDGPIDGLTSAQRSIFVRGDEAFGEQFSFQTGLGPVFNQPSCQSCHAGDGKGHPSVNLIRFGMNTASGFDMLMELGGPLFDLAWGRWEFRPRSAGPSLPNHVPVSFSPTGPQSLFPPREVSRIPPCIALSH